MNCNSEKVLSRANRSIAAAIVLLLLLVQTISASAALHADVHEHAEDATHECAATLLSNGHVDLSIPAAVVQLPPVEISLLLRESAPLSGNLFSSSHTSRGPPSLV